MQNKMMLLMMFCQLLGTLFTVWVFQTFVNKESFPSIGLRFANYESDFFQGLLVGGILISSGFLILFIFNLIEVKLTYFSFYDQIFYFFLFAIVSLNEEIAIRGYILQNLSQSFNKYIALAISSLVFMLMHIGNPNIGVLPLVNLFLAGMFLGIYTVHKNNLWFPIGMNFSWNYLKGLVCNFWNYHHGMNSIFIHNLKAG